MSLESALSHHQTPDTRGQRSEIQLIIYLNISVPRQCCQSVSDIFLLVTPRWGVNIYQDIMTVLTK